MAEKYDVVVVGARVAGASTGMLLARLGHRVLIVDRAGPPRDTLSTHALLRPAVLQLQRWGVLDRIVDRGTPAISRLSLGFGADRISFDLQDAYGVDALYAPRRTVLDAELLQAAQDAGAEFRTGVSVVDVTRDESGRAGGVVVNTPGGAETIPARFVVGADGRFSKVAESVAASTYATQEANNSVIYAYFADLETEGFEWQFTPGFTAGYMPTNDGQVNVWMGAPIGERRIDTRQAFPAWLAATSPDMAAEVAAATRVSPFRVGSISTFLRVPGGPGWALVGDAGSTNDPISAHGISNALRDAELAARAVAASLEDPPSEPDALQHYHEIRDELALPIYREAAALAAYRWDEAEASARLRTLGRAGDAESELLSSLPPWPQTAPRMAA